MTRVPTEKQLAARARNVAHVIQRAVDRGALICVHRCDGCKTEESFERKQFGERGWKRAWSIAPSGLRQQIELCPECRRKRAAKRHAPVGLTPMAACGTVAENGPA